MGDDLARGNSEQTPPTPTAVNLDPERGIVQKLDHSADVADHALVAVRKWRGVAHAVVLLVLTVVLGIGAIWAAIRGLGHVDNVERWLHLLQRKFL